MIKDKINSIITSGHVFTFVASERSHSYISQLAVFAKAFTAKKSYFISSHFISISNFGSNTFSINSSSSFCNFL
ncbi:hypothetical protein HOG21_05905 [bacterium]|jgi:hypothetical protein|nr:hypothetical protein [bacterium]